MKEVKVKIKKTKVIGTISACTLPLKDDVNYRVVLYDQSFYMKQWCYGKELEVLN
jgi:hypothetical protein